MYVLLVEDEPVVQQIHLTLLQKMGCKVDVASSGEDAVAKSRNHYDLIFMDIGLPGISGIQAAKEICNQKKMNNAPIIFLTAYVDKDTQNECLVAGGDAVYIKPINMDTFTQIIKKFSKVIYEKK